MKYKQVRYNTNLAGEFWVLSALNRLGLEAHLTLGNKKSVDIVIVHSPQKLYTVEVKSLADKYDWPANNIRTFDDASHFYVMLSFEGHIGEPEASPSAWIIPSGQMKDFMKLYGTRWVVRRTLLMSKGNEFKDAWALLM